MADHTILLVEDNADDVLLIRRAFRKANLANPLQVVGDGEAAVAYLAGDGPFADRAAHPLPVFVLLDLKLPRMDGFELLQWARSRPDLRRLPIVVLTTSREGADVRRAYDLGANSYLLKPVQFESLIDMVRSLNAYWAILNVPPDLSPGPPPP